MDVLNPHVRIFTSLSRKERQSSHSVVAQQGDSGSVWHFLGMLLGDVVRQECSCPGCSAVPVSVSVDCGFFQPWHMEDNPPERIFMFMA